METTFSDIISILSLLAGGGGISFFFTLRWARKKAKAEADRAVAEAMQAQAEAKRADISAEKERQDYYSTTSTSITKNCDKSATTTSRSATSTASGKSRWHALSWTGEWSPTTTALR